MALRVVAYAVIGGAIGYFWWLSLMWQAEAVGPETMKEVMPTILFVPIFVLCGASYVFVSKERHGPWTHVENATMVVGLFLLMPAVIPLLAVVPAVWSPLVVMAFIGSASLIHQWIFYRLNRRAGWPPTVSTRGEDDHASS